MYLQGVQGIQLAVNPAWNLIWYIGELKVYSKVQYIGYGGYTTRRYPCAATLQVATMNAQ